MTDARGVVFPDRLGPDIETERAKAELRRLGEVDALLREREQTLRQRETVRDSEREPLGVVVDAQGRDTGMRVKRVTQAMHAEQVQEELARLGVHRLGN